MNLLSEELTGSTSMEISRLLLVPQTSSNRKESGFLLHMIPIDYDH